MKIKVVLLSLSLALGTSSAWAGEYSCGCAPPPPLKVKANAGVGNGAEVDGSTGATTEDGDLDPGNSGAHNQAYRNVDRTQSPNRLDINRLP